MPLQRGETAIVEASRAHVDGAGDVMEKAAVQITLVSVDLASIVPIVQRFRMKKEKIMTELPPERGRPITVPRTTLRALLTHGGKRRFVSQTDPAYAVTIEAFGESCQSVTLAFPPTTWGGTYHLSADQLQQLIDY